MSDGLELEKDRRRIERRTNPRVADLPLAEFRRMLVTLTLFLVALFLFLWMVRSVIIAAILGAVIAIYLRPLYSTLRKRVGHPVPAAILALTVVILPVVGVLVYSYLEIRKVVEVVAGQEAAIAAQIDATIRQLPFAQGADTYETVRRMVTAASDYGARLPEAISGAVASIAISAAVFLFTAFYIFTDAEEIAAYIRGKVPPRYVELATALEENVSGVLYGAIYATLATQAIKSAVILGLNLLLGVPLAAVLGILSFIIGFFPIVGSWSVYVPVAVWLLVFQDSLWAALLMVGVGFLVNTVFLSMYLRPKMAAQKSRVLNFYWMFVGLIAGVYTFGLAGILLGPILIGLLKAILDTVTSRTSWRLIEDD